MPEENEQLPVNGQTNNLALAELARKIDEQAKTQEEILFHLKKIHQWIWWRKAYFWLKLAVLVIVVAAASWYLPTLINQALAPYRSLLETTNQTNQALQNAAGSLPNIDWSNLWNNTKQ